MVGLMAHPQVDIEASCAICGAPPFPECPHEGERLQLALGQAMERWAGVERIREWVLNHARNQIITTFQQLRAMRVEAHRNYIQTLPYYTLYQRYNGHPPMERAQLQIMHNQIHQANSTLRQGIDQDWRTSCLRYPEVLDYYFSLVDVDFPRDSDSVIQQPVFNGDRKPPATTRRIRRDSAEIPKEHRKKERRRSRGRETPPPAPMPDMYRHARRKNSDYYD